MNGCEKVFHTMKEKGMDLAVLLDPADIKYVSGFEVPFWPAWMGDVSNGLPMVTAIVDAKREQIQLVASDMYRNKIEMENIWETGKMITEIPAIM